MKKLIIAIVALAAVAMAKPTCSGLHDWSKNRDIYYCVNTAPNVAYEKIVFGFAIRHIVVMKDGTRVDQYPEEPIWGDMYSETLYIDRSNRILTEPELRHKLLWEYPIGYVRLSKQHRVTECQRKKNCTTFQ